MHCATAILVQALVHGNEPADGDIRGTQHQDNDNT